MNTTTTSLGAPAALAPDSDDGPYRTPAVVNVEVSYEGVDRRFDQLYLDELKLPRDEVLRLHGHGDPTFYERFRRDPQVEATFRRRRAQVIAKEWQVEAGGTDPIDIAAADHLRAQIKAMSWDRVSFRMLGGLWPGYAVGECMFSIGTDGLVCIDAIKVRRSGRFRFTNGGELRMLLPTAPFGTELPPKKMWVFRAGAEDDDEPYGLGLAHYCYWPIWFLRNVTQFWAHNCEEKPTPHAQVPPGTKDEDRSKVERTVSNAVATGGTLVTSSNVTVEYLQAARDAGPNFGAFIQYCKDDITKVILTQTMTTEDGSSQSQAEVHMAGEIVLTKSDADMHDESFMAGPATWVTQWNFPGAKTPIVSRDFASSENLDSRADRDSKLATAGWRMTPDAFAKVYGEGYIYSTPPPAEGAPGAAPAAFSEAAGAALLANERAQSRRLASGVVLFLGNRHRGEGNLPADFDEGAVADVAGAVEQLIANDGWRRVLGPQVDALDHMIGDARSLLDVRDRLGEIALSNPGTLTDALSRVLFAARIQGQAGADGSQAP